GDIKALIMVGADPVADVPDSHLATEALANAEFVVAIDMFHTESTAYADVILPALGFAEKEGTVTNLEGRVQKVNDIVAGAGQSRRSSTASPAGWARSWASPPRRRSPRRSPRWPRRTGASPGTCSSGTSRWARSSPTATPPSRSSTCR